MSPVERDRETWRERGVSWGKRRKRAILYSGLQCSPMHDVAGPLGPSATIFNISCWVSQERKRYKGLNIMRALLETFYNVWRMTDEEDEQPWAVGLCKFPSPMHVRGKNTAAKRAGKQKKYTMAVHIFFPEKGGRIFGRPTGRKHSIFNAIKLLDYKNKIPLERQTIWLKIKMLILFSHLLECFKITAYTL